MAVDILCPLDDWDTVQTIPDWLNREADFSSYSDKLEEVGAAIQAAREMGLDSRIKDLGVGLHVPDFEDSASPIDPYEVGRKTFLIKEENNGTTYRVMFHDPESWHGLEI